MGRAGSRAASGVRQTAYRLARSDVGRVEHPYSVCGDSMNEELRHIKELAKYIELETENDRHSELCKLGIIISMAREILDIGMAREEKLESLN